MFERVILADDGSPIARTAVPRAAALAAGCGSEVLVVRVSHAAGTRPQDLDESEWRRYVSAEGRAEAAENPLEAEPHLSEVLNELQALGVENVGSLVLHSGDAGDALVEAADRLAAGLLVLTSRGQGGQFTNKATPPQCDPRCGQRNYFTAKVRTDGFGHFLHGVSHHPHRSQFQAGQHTTWNRGQPAQPHPQSDHQYHRRQGKSQPCGKATPPARPKEADPKDRLTARRPRQELAQGHQIRIGLIGQPSPAGHAFLPEIAQVGHRTTKGGQTEPQKHQKYLDHFRSARIVESR